MFFYRSLLISLLLILSTGKLFATHFYGVDLFYTYVSGNTYRVTMVAYGDCSGDQFPSFAIVRPKIYIKKGNTDFLADFLDHEPPKIGVEVTPVCPAELNNTTCKNAAGTVPGVTKFVYSKEFVLSGPAPDWRFIFLGETDGNTLAGRSNSLTNVGPVGTISLEATLNNAQNNNSSPVYTTIATPFYCVNMPTNFNPGAVDADGDSLVYELVPGLNPDLSTLNYLSGFSSSNPLNVAPGTFKFSRSTGQLSFTPSTLQKSLVVYRVSEYRNGKLMGTSMREMTVVVMNCNNNPPAGYVTGPSGALLADSVTVKTCSGNRELAFDINPNDSDGHIINMVANGLPKNSRLDITGNNTTSPKSRFVWNMPDLPLGSYTFFVTYTDNGCPIASKQTQAYTIRIVHEDIAAETIASGCLNQGLIKLLFPTTWSPWAFKISNSAGITYNVKDITTGNWSDSVATGKYNIEATNAFGCTSNTVADIPTDCSIIDLPNAFSPNGDGSNDILYVMGGDVEEMHLKIYNRWGQMVFETHDKKTGWDGTYKGKEAPVEAYAYVLSGIFKSSKVFEKQGNVSLLR